jgi:hypothetical protein
LDIVARTLQTATPEESSNHPERNSVQCKRSVLFQAEHLAWIDAIWERKVHRSEKPNWRWLWYLDSPGKLQLPTARPQSGERAWFDIHVLSSALLIFPKAILVGAIAQVELLNRLAGTWAGTMLLRGDS